MTSPAIISAASAIDSPYSAVKKRAISPMISACACQCSLTIRKSNIKRVTLFPLIKAAASDSTVIVDNPTVASISEEEETPVKIGARVRVTVPLKVYHVPKVSEVELKGMEGKIKEYVALWKGKSISANLPYKIEFLEKLEGRGDTPVKFFAHLKEDEFEYID